MCGIYAAIGKYSIEKVREASNKIAHRGPDGNGEWVSEKNSVYFKHFRLNIIDLSESSNQPMFDSTGRFVLIYNGEIFNYIELRKEFESRYKFSTNSDSEVILAGYLLEGSKIVNRLRGMFAFIIYDQLKNEFFIARDRFGIKPLYYLMNSGCLYFSSEIKSLITKANNSINENSVVKFLQFRQMDSNLETFFKDIYQFPIASFAYFNIDNFNLRITKYWQFPDSFNELYKPEIHREELNQFLMDCIKIHLRSDVTVGSFVSGGIDSSVITAYALSQFNGNRFHTFSAILQNRNDENKLIPYIQNLPNIESHEYFLDGNNFFESLENIIYYHDEPLLDGSMYSHYKLCKLAKDNGIKVLLSGSGGDELFGGYKSHIYAYLAYLIEKFEFIRFIKDLKKISLNNKINKLELIIKTLHEILPSKLKNIIKNHQINNLQKFLNYTLPKNYNFYPFHDEDSWNNNFKNNYFSWTVPPYLHYEDRNSMANGVEVRVPFYDHILIEKIRKFSPQSLMQDKSKYLLRDLSYQKLPQEILQQKVKFGFPSPIDTLLQKDKKSKSFFYEYALSLPFINKKELLVLANNFWKTGKNQDLYWRFMSIGLWYHKFYK